MSEAFKTYVVKGLGKAYGAIHKGNEEDGKPVYDIPFYIPGVQQVGTTPNEQTAELWAEDRLWETASETGSIDVSADFTDIPTDIDALLYGKKRDAQGGVIDNSDNEKPYFALMFSKKLTSGVIEYCILYKGMAKLPTDTVKSKQQSPEFQNKTIASTFMALDNGLWRYTVRDCNMTPEQKLEWETNIWGKKVYVPEALPETVIEATSLIKGGNK